MSKGIRIELNRAGVRALLKSQEMEAGLQGLADGIRDRCGAGYGSDTKQMGTRVIASIYTDDDAARRDNSENNTILRALL